ncbi:MAG: hypothetical protein HF975_17065 [ANME-2 cluster archaeon]|nr:hypothetical protein [ANME-2 cluster archaeon]
MKNRSQWTKFSGAGSREIRISGSQQSREEMIKNLLDFEGLLERKGDKVGTFSKGMKSKLGLARAMIQDPDVLFHKSNCRFDIPN